MVNWEDPAEVSRDFRILGAITLLLVGVATWELVVTFAFDWSIITGRRKRRWSMVLYFLSRLGMILPVWTMAVLDITIGRVNCQALDWIHKGFECVGMSASSAILALRAWAVLERDSRVGVGLLVLSLGQVVLMAYLDSLWRISWNPSKMTCKGHAPPVNPAIFVATPAYNMCFDFIIFVLMVTKLSRHARRGGISALLLNDGIFYFIATCLANGTAFIFAVLPLNPWMNMMGVSFSYVVCTISATRLFRHPFEDSDSLSRTNPASSGVLSPIVFRSGGRVAMTTHNSEIFVLDRLDVQPTPGIHTAEAVYSQKEIDMQREVDKKIG